MANPQEKTVDLFIVNEVYPLQPEAHKYFKGRLDKCFNDERCKSWVKYDAETYVKEHGKKVGEKIEQSGKKLTQAVYSNRGQEKGFFNLADLKYTGEDGDSNYNGGGKSLGPIKLNGSLLLAVLALGLIVLGIYKKSYAIGFIGVILGVGMYLTREK